MALIIHRYTDYGITGKIIDVNDRSSTLTISVTSPFVSEVKFHCSSYHYDILHPPTFKYNWISWVQGDGHPNEPEASAYYNTEDKCFYKKESGSESEWERTDFEDIYDDNPNLLGKNRNMQEKYGFFLFKYIPILHKEQVCHFSAYAVQRDNIDSHSIQNNQVKRHPEDYFWIYDSDTFHGEKWDAESIDGLVQEIRPSRNCVEWLLESYKTEDREAKRKEPFFNTLLDILSRYFPGWLVKGVIVTFIGGLIAGLILSMSEESIFRNFITLLDILSSYSPGWLVKGVIVTFGGGLLLMMFGESIKKIIFDFLGNSRVK